MAVGGLAEIAAKPRRWLRCTMKSDTEKHHRRAIRLKSYDYSSFSAYFITICTQQRLCLFGDIVDGIIVFNEVGRMIEQTFEEMSAEYTGVQTDVFIVMPNHLHGIINIENGLSVGVAPRGRPLSISNKSNEFLTDDVDRGWMIDNRTQVEGQPRGGAPTDERRMSLSDIVHRRAPNHMSATQTA